MTASLLYFQLSRVDDHSLLSEQLHVEYSADVRRPVVVCPDYVGAEPDGFSEEIRSVLKMVIELFLRQNTVECLNMGQKRPDAVVSVFLGDCEDKRNQKSS